MNHKRLDQVMILQGKVNSRSQAENLIKLGKVKVSGSVVDKPGKKVAENADVVITAEKTYVSRAALKLESVASRLGINFFGKTVLDVGSSSGGFTDFALQHGAAYVIAVDVGTNQLDASLRTNPKIELHEQTDIRAVNKLSKKVDIVVIDVSFISIREVLLHLLKIIEPGCLVIAMVKPQFESVVQSQRQKGVIKNESIRRDILKDFEYWAKSKYKIFDKADSEIKGEKGNLERFYLISPLSS